MSDFVPLKRTEMTYMEAMDTEGGTKCGWCRKPCTGVARMSVSSPELHIAVAPACELCFLEEQAKAKWREGGKG